MSKRADILEAAEAAFETHGFHAVPIDTVVTAAGVSPRTVYAHFPSKTLLALEVLKARHTRFLQQMRARLDAEPHEPVAALFHALRDWLVSSRSAGCLFLRALGEFGDAPSEPVVSAYQAALRDLVREAVVLQGGDAEDGDGILLLIEGATAAAPSLGVDRAIAVALQAAKTLLNTTRKTETAA